jgi:Mg2+/citrate symporter
MTSEQVQSTVLNIIERWGFPTLVAVACLYVGRQDVLLPLVKAHTQFLEKLAQTQIEIATAVQEQTRLLYALQPGKSHLPPLERPRDP